ncbi:flagellar assembly protein FliH [Janthinobacterium sp.]|uniref:flagellar assembly protein FliH n=1 Tax=Janthinobacterium sp. TaxID=1871054 RepID=UPI00293D79CB|nr:flagellar assembly protein FliH [Janthinobacterium sp.]
MSNLPKEQQTAYQRWEMTSFGDERPSVVAARKPPEPEALPEPELEAPPPLDYPTQEELDAIREQARAEAYAEGLAAGHAAGHVDGRAEALAAGQAEAAIELAHLRALALEFAAALAGADELIAAEVLELALQLAKGMLKTALRVKPELLLPVVREAIEYLPVLQQPAILMLNPEDAKVVRDGIAEELDKGGWRVVEDASVERGGCKIDTASNQIDAQTSARWQRLSQALGKDVDWLAP